MLWYSNGLDRVGNTFALRIVAILLSTDEQHEIGEQMEEAMVTAPTRVQSMDNLGFRLQIPEY